MRARTRNPAYVNVPPRSHIYCQMPLHGFYHGVLQNSVDPENNFMEPVFVRMPNGFGLTATLTTLRNVNVPNREHRCFIPIGNETLTAILQPFQGNLHIERNTYIFVRLPDEHTIISGKLVRGNRPSWIH